MAVSPPGVTTPPVAVSPPVVVPPPSTVRTRTTIVETRRLGPVDPDEDPNDGVLLDTDGDGLYG